MTDWPIITEAEILAARGPRHEMDMMRPWAFLVEPELSDSGEVEDVATIFLTNKECPFRCLMCDLWQNTLTTSVDRGAIPKQIDFALSQLPPARHLKLYNSANFFDPSSIPESDYPEIVVRTARFQSVIVENHPKFIGRRVLKFRDQLQAHNTDLEVALGLETIHPDVLPRLNKQMELEDFENAVTFLTAEGIRVRAFVLLRPPFLSEDEGVEWAVRSCEYAYSLGVSVCSIIPTRAGNGAMEQLQANGMFTPPRLSSMEAALELALELPTNSTQRVFIDLWDAQKFATCAQCATRRVDRLQSMNRLQKRLPRISEDCCKQI